jgi:hypothetical protein
MEMKRVKRLKSSRNYGFILLIIMVAVTSFYSLSQPPTVSATQMQPENVNGRTDSVAVVGGDCVNGNNCVEHYDEPTAPEPTITIIAEPHTVTTVVWIKSTFTGH